SATRVVHTRCSTVSSTDAATLHDNEALQSVATTTSDPSATLTVNAPASLGVATLTAGRLDGTAAVTASALNWAAGTIAGGGVDVAGAVAMTPGAKTLDAPLTHRGTSTWTQPLALADGGVV